MSKRYKVASYENSDLPEPRWLDAGEFDTPGEALVCAHRIIRASLKGLYHANRGPGAEGLLMAYRCYGPVPAIFGEPRITFDPYQAARGHARALARGSGAAPPA
jgi:hypothetical protein